MAQLLDRASGYEAALHDLVAAMKLAAEARDRKLCSQAGLEQILRDELASRWQIRIDRGEVPEGYSAHMALAVSEAAAAILMAPAVVLVGAH